MSDRSCPQRVQRTLDALAPAAAAIATHQLSYATGVDDQLTTIAQVWELLEEGRDAAGVARWFRDMRTREARDMRRAGAAADAADLVDQDPTGAGLAVMEYLDQVAAAGWSIAAAPATFGQEPALLVPQVAAASHRGLRTVQIRMRLLCRAELRGQGVLPGVPTASAVYRARALAGAA